MSSILATRGASRAACLGLRLSRTSGSSSTSRYLSRELSTTQQPLQRRVQVSFSTGRLAVQASSGFETGQKESASRVAQQPMVTSGPTVPGLTDTVWGAQDLEPKYPSLSADTEADVCVVGGGLSGLCIAYNLQKQGKQVVLIESRTIGAGNTGRSMGDALAWWDDYIHRVADEKGADGAATLAASVKRAVDFLEEVINSEKIECDFQRVPTFVYAPSKDPESLGLLDKELEAAKKAGLTEAKWVSLEGKPEHGGINKALQFSGSAQFHPLKLVQGMACVLEKAGGKIYEQTHMVSQALNGSRVETRHGPKVTAQKVVLATHSPLIANLAVHARQVPERSYVSALTVPKGKVPQADFVDIGEPNYRVRVVQAEGDGDDILLVSGGNHHMGRQYKDYWTDIEGWARHRWPDAGATKMHWSAEAYQPAEKLHMIGLNPLDPTGSTYVVTGDSNQPATMAAIAAEAITDHILGRKNASYELFDPSRLPNLKDVPGIGEYLSGTVEGYAKYAVPNFKDSDSLQPGEGGIFQRGAIKAAVYRDEQGQKHVRSAICTHLGCQVEWNPNEKCFDCGCHGSAFDCYGRVLSGPAATDLKDVEDLGTAKAVKDSLLH